jgi:hypothetical protein
MAMPTIYAQSRLYFTAASAAVDRVRQTWATILPAVSLAPPGSEDFDAESDEILHALLGCGMAQLDAIGNPRYEQTLREQTFQFCADSGCRIPLIDAYEKVWAAGADDLEKASRVGGMLLSRLNPNPPLLLWQRTYFMAAGTFLWEEAAVLWQRVDHSLSSQHGQARLPPK